jgi:DNA-binding NtrC family response regulator
VHGPNLDVLYARDWPGNVRELRNVVDRAIALSPGATCFDELRLAPRTAAGDEPQPSGAGVRADLPYAEAKQAVLHEFERRYLRDVLARCEGNISATARATGLDRKHLRTLLRRHGLVES